MNRAFSLLLAALSSACHRDESNVSSTGNGFNVVILTLDTTRRDFMGFLGRDPSPTPNLDRLASKAIVFEDAYTVTPLTLPAHTSLMTGLYPYSHGIRENSVLRLPEEATTLAEILQARGYSTTAHVAAYVLDKSYGLDQGFDVYTGPVVEPALRADYIPERRADSVVDVALRSLEEPSEPFLLWVHLFDPHFPYQDEASGQPPHRQMSKVEQNANRRRAYENEIRFADQQLGRLLDDLEAGPLGSRTLIAFAADHGEGLDDGKETTHGSFLYDQTMRIPLLIRDPRLAAGRMKGPVSLIDVVPTVLDLLDMKEAAPPMDGISLRSFLHSSPAIERTVAMEAYNVYFQHGWAPMEGVADRSRKLIHSREDELYDRLCQPPETANLIGEEPLVASRMRAALEHAFEERAQKLDPRKNVDAQAGLLEDLGYVDHGMKRSYADRPDCSNLPSALANQELLRRDEEVMLATVEKRHADAIGHLQWLCDQAPRSAHYRSQLAALLLEHQPSRIDDAERLLLEVVGLQSPRAEDVFNLGLISMRRMQGAADPAMHRDRAIDYYRECLELSSSHAMALANLASLLEPLADEEFRAQRWQEAGTHYQEIIDLYQRYVSSVAPTHVYHSRIVHRLEQCRKRLGEIRNKGG